MSSFKDQNRDENSRSHNSSGFALWYYERHDDGRLSFHLAPLAWALFIVPTILAVMAIISLYVYNSMTPAPQTDVTIHPRDTSGDAPPTETLIKRAPPGPTPPRIRTRTNINLNVNSGNPAARPQPNGNGNDH
jgi:heme/copper-type cytochrome/quinol oxidase subunit 2